MVLLFEVMCVTSILLLTSMSSMQAAFFCSEYCEEMGKEKHNNESPWMVA